MSSYTNFIWHCNLQPTKRGEVKSSYGQMMARDRWLERSCIQLQNGFSYEYQSKNFLLTLQLATRK